MVYPEGLNNADLDINHICPMQSDGNNFGGDVVLDSFNLVKSDEDSI